jgi:hypothetical protein
MDSVSEPIVGGAVWDCLCDEEAIWLELPTFCSSKGENSVRDGGGQGVESRSKK